MNDHVQQGGLQDDSTPIFGSDNMDEFVEQLRTTGRKRTGNVLDDIYNRLHEAHPELFTEFQSPALGLMDDATKRLLIKNIYQILEIYPKEPDI